MHSYQNFRLWQYYIKSLILNFKVSEVLDKENYKAAIKNFQNLEKLEGKEQVEMREMGGLVGRVQRSALPIPNQFAFHPHATPSYIQFTYIYIYCK